jgi:DNA-binding transcriptional LysR family regulator
MDQPMVLMRADHPLASGTEVDVAQLRDAVMLIWNQEATRGLMDAFFSVCDRHGFRPTVQEVATTPGALATELDRGAGVAIVARAWASNAILGKNLVSLPLRQPALALAGVVAWSKDGRPTVVSAVRSWLSRQ